MNDMSLVNEQFRALKTELANQRKAMDLLAGKIENVSSAFAPRIYSSLAVANEAMLLEGNFYTGFAFAIIANVRDIGEGAGAGTGALCIWKPSPINEWRRLDNTTAVI